MDVTTVSGALGMEGPPPRMPEPASEVRQDTPEPEKPPVEVVTKADYQGQQVDTQA